MYCLSKQYEDVNEVEVDENSYERDLIYLAVNLITWTKN